MANLYDSTFRFHIYRVVSKFLKVDVKKHRDHNQIALFHLHLVSTKLGCVKEKTFEGIKGDNIFEDFFANFAGTNTTSAVCLFHPPSFGIVGPSSRSSVLSACVSVSTLGSLALIFTLNLHPRFHNNKSFSNWSRCLRCTLIAYRKAAAWVHIASGPGWPQFSNIIFLIFPTFLIVLSLLILCLCYLGYFTFFSGFPQMFGFWGSAIWKYLEIVLKFFP